MALPFNCDQLKVGKGGLPRSFCRKQVKLSLSICACVLLIAGEASAKTSLCSILKSDSDEWVTRRVNALVRTAHSAYESDDALPAYHRVLDGINRTLQRCKLSADA